MQISRDIRYGLRRLFRDRKLTATIILIAALGTGPTAAVLSLLRATLLHALPYTEPGSLVVAWNATARSPKAHVAAAQVEEWRQHRELFSGVAAMGMPRRLVLAGGAESVQVQAVSAMPEIFEVLGVAAVLGRTLSPADSNDSAMIGYEFWQRQFRGDRSVIGSRIQLGDFLGDRFYTVVGIMPERFDFPRLLYPVWKQFDIWLPLKFTPQELAGNALSVDVIARLAGTNSPQIASRRLSLLVPQQLRQTVVGVNVVKMQEAVVGGTRAGLILLAGGVALVLLLVCVNITNLLLAGLEARRREVATRLALGATRARVAREFLIELLLLSLGGAAIGLLLARWTLPAITVILPADFPRLGNLAIDRTVIALTLLSAMAATVLAGLAPAFTAAVGPVAESLTSSIASAGSAPKRQRLRGALVITEVALAIVLTTSAALTLRSYRRLVSLSADFAPAGVLTASITLPNRAYPERQRLAFVDTLLDQLHAIPALGVPAIASGIPGVFAAASGAPLSPVSGVDGGRRASPHQVNVDFASDDYFRALGIPLVQGRSFNSNDRPNSQLVAVIDTAAARLLGPESPLEREFVLWDPKTVYRIVGVVGRVRLIGQSKNSTPHVYLPASQEPLPQFTLVLRTSEPAINVASILRGIVAGIDPHLPVSAVTPLANRIAAQTSGPRFHLTMLGLFGGLALALAAIGVFSITEYIVSLRRHEFAIRSSLGASSGALAMLILRGGIKLLGCGLGVGLAATFLTSNVLAASLPEVDVNDPATIGIAVAVVVFAAASAILIPALRVSEVDPVSMLRSQ
jgi:predicted permease